MIRRRTHRRRRAFTLIEAIATITVLAVLGSIASVIIVNAVDGYAAASASAQLHAELSITFDRLAREFRRIGVDSSAVGAAPNIASVTPTSIVWNNTYSLSLSGSQLIFVENGASPAVLLEDVSAMSIQTYDEDNAPLASNLSGTACDPIRRIVLEVTVQRNGVSETLRTKVFVRSMLAGIGEGG